MEVTGTGEKTALAGIMRLVSQAQSSRSRAQALADRAAFYLTLVAIGAGALTLAACGGSADEARQPVADTTGASGAAPTAAVGEGTVYTADEGSNALSAIDLASDRVTTVPLGITPHNVQVSADGRLLLTIGPVAAARGHGETRPTEQGMSEESMEMRGRVVILDPADLQAAPAEVEVGRHPAHVIADAAGQRAYASNSEDNTLTVIDLARRQAVGTIPVCEFPHGMRMSPNGREIYAWIIHQDIVDATRIGISAFSRFTSWVKPRIG